MRALYKRIRGTEKVNWLFLLTLSHHTTTEAFNDIEKQQT